MSEHYERLYTQLMFPQIYGMPYEDAVQLDLFDNGRQYLKTGKGTLDQANIYGKDRTQFKKGNQQGIRFISKDVEGDEDQLQLDVDQEEPADELN